MNDIARTRWGILSTGHMAGRFAEALNQLPEAELVAVVHAAGRRPRPSQRRMVCNAYEALAADPGIDVSYFGTPHTLHLENATTCLLAGKVLLCEKALIINAAKDC